MSDTRPPSAFQLERMIFQAQQTIEALRTEHGLILDTGDDVLAVLSEEGVDVGTILRSLIHATLDSKALGVAADQRIADLRQRRERFARHEQTYRTLIQNVMDALGLKKFSSEEALLTIGIGQPKVQIVDETALPEMMMKVTVTRAPDKAMIKGALDAGVEVPGASLSNGGSVLTIRSR